MDKVTASLFFQLWLNQKSLKLFLNTGIYKKFLYRDLAAETEGKTKRFHVFKIKFPVGSSFYEEFTWSKSEAFDVHERFDFSALNTSQNNRCPVMLLNSTDADTSDGKCLRHFYF